MNDTKFSDVTAPVTLGVSRHWCLNNPNTKTWYFVGIPPIQYELGFVFKNTTVFRFNTDLLQMEQSC